MAQLLEPPCTDPYARWCGRGQRATAAPMPIKSPTHSSTNEIKASCQIVGNLDTCRLYGNLDQGTSRYAEIISPKRGPTFSASFVFVLLLPYIPPATPLLRRSLTSTLRFSARPDGDSLEPTGLVSPIAPGARMRPTGTPQS
jgi:hypothetical protein